ncbi:PREDICTED: uncharacterized protein LOC105561472 [Vollenhovia emeryi]|uniref:uncharacterized protein LOC105561472 n=1 Tax=Vollenhovia emeryi TaxID=411798 RepID=UPI0005F3B8C2|nr:PREDICTED: uncharacterized protein LOC105561472 [Vollenhovia emeryi]
MGAKRRRVSSRCRQSPEGRKECTLDTLPPEILCIILKMLPLHNVARIVRLVSRRCSDIAATVLNSEFLVAGTKLEIAIKRMEDLMSNVKTDTELLECNKIFNALELIRSQYRVLKAVTWRYTHPRFLNSSASNLLYRLSTPKFNHKSVFATITQTNGEFFTKPISPQGKMLIYCIYEKRINTPLLILFTLKRSRLPVSCFYGGRILDNLNYLLQTAFNPCRGSHAFSYSDLQIFTRSCENFMDHFERTTERKLNESALISGCKIVDVLDCLEEGRQVLSFRISSRTDNPMVSMHLEYVLRRTWFACLPVPNSSYEYCWRDKQRYMYLRLRRLVSSYNRHLFQKLHYERKLILRAMVPQLPSRRLPPASTYSGYGEYGGQFFYYGNMSKYAYENRFKYPRASNAGNTGEGLEEETNRSCFDLVIGVQLRQFNKN